MTLKKLLVSLLALIVTSVGFALPTPPDDNDPMAQAFEQYADQVGEMNQKFDQLVLPPLKGMLQIANAFGNTTQENLTPEQEEAWNQYQAALIKAFNDIVTPIVEQADMQQVNDMLKQMFTAADQPVHEINKQEFTDILIGMTTLSALGHFQETKKLTEEEIELAMLLFFPSEEEMQQ